MKFDDVFFRENLLKTNYSVDSESDVIVLYEKGEVHIKPYGTGYHMVYHLHRILKFLKGTDEALKFANVKEIYPNSGDADVFANNIKGTTYNIDNETIVKSNLDNKAVYDKRIDRNYHEMAFAMPSVREGSIIDYEFEIVDKHYFFLPLWEFKSRVPKLVSEYEVSSPIDLNSIQSPLVIYLLKNLIALRELKM